MDKFTDIEYTSDQEIADMTTGELLDLEYQTIVIHDNVMEVVNSRIGDAMTIKFLPHPDKDIVRQGYNIARYCNNLIARINRHRNTCQTKEFSMYYIYARQFTDKGEDTIEFLLVSSEDLPSRRWFEYSGPFDTLDKATQALSWAIAG